MIIRNIEEITKKPTQHWVGDGFHVSNYFPSTRNYLNRFSPFILLDYNPKEMFQPTSIRRGVGAHPHRGFETVTFAFEGAVEHHDNKNHHGIIYPGNIQWMTAGSGVMHKEYHEADFSQTGGYFHMIQLWVNLPSKMKMIQPNYQAIKSNEMGVYQYNNAKVTVYAGEYKTVLGPAKTQSLMNIYRVDLDEQATIILKEKATFNLGLLVIEGNCVINQEEIHSGDFILFKNEEGEALVETLSEKVSLIVLSGEPIDEPVVAMGPFVMNSRKEITEAYIDFENGKFGSDNF